MRLAELDAALGALPPAMTSNQRPSQATRLVELSEDAELFHDSEGTGYATLHVDGHKEHWPVRSKGFRDWLSHRYYESERKVTSSQGMNDAVATIQGKARFDGDKRSVFLRVGESEGVLYLDLCDSLWRAVRVTTKGWEVVSNPPICFVRRRGMLALPEPCPNGCLDALWPYLNLSIDEERVLVGVWLLAALRREGPYPVLVVQGEQGTAKSTLLRVLRSLIDPSVAPLRAIPRDERDLMIWARNGWTIAFDNLSGVPNWLSDALCRLATGGGFSTRELYSDTDEVLIDVQRPVMANGIDDIATRQDLIDRAIILHPTPIPESRRKSEKQFWSAFAEEQPQTLGALLTALSAALTRLPMTKLDRHPRMADFAILGAAAELGLGFPQDCFAQAYSDNRQSAVEAGLEASPVAEAARRLIHHVGVWAGTATELLPKLEEHADDRVRQLRSWPKSARGLSCQLRRLATALRAVGIEIDFRHSGDRKITVSHRDAAGWTQIEGAAVPWAQTGRKRGHISSCKTEQLDAKDGVDANLRPLSDEGIPVTQDDREIIEL